MGPRYTTRLWTTTPTVRRYRSSNSESTKRRTRDVFPTPSPPTRQIFSFADSVAAGVELLANSRLARSIQLFRLILTERRRQAGAPAVKKFREVARFIDPARFAGDRGTRPRQDHCREPGPRVRRSLRPRPGPAMDASDPEGGERLPRAVRPGYKLAGDASSGKAGLESTIRITG